MGFSNQEIDKFYGDFKTTYLNLASGVKSYTINTGTSSRSLTRSGLPQIKQEFIYWAKLKASKNNPANQNSGIGKLPVIPLDT